MPERLSGGELIARMLAIENVDKVFGIIDGTYFGFYSALRKFNIELISPRHETSAAHLAGAYYRFSGKLGVCMASNGPGVANLLPGLVVEQAEGNRILAITSFRRKGIVNPVRKGTYQYFDQTKTIEVITKASFLIMDYERIEEIMRMAFRKCYEGRPGVVHIDVPEDIMNGKFTFSISLYKPHQYRLMSNIYPDPKSLEAVIHLLKNSQYPMIHFGSGIVHAQAFEELSNFINTLKIPATYSWGAISSQLHNEFVIPMTNIELNHFVHQNADFALVLSSRLGETDWWGKKPYWDQTRLKIVQVDIDPEIIGASRNIELGIISDIKVFLQILLKLINEKNLSFNVKWNSKKKKMDSLRNKYQNHLQKILKEKIKGIHPAKFIEILNRLSPEDSVYVIDGGNTAVWAFFFLKIKSIHSFISTYKFGMLGAGVAQAIGASFARNKQTIICLIGDGAMGFHPQEVETAVRTKRKIIYIVFCDKQWGMVKINQSFSLKPLKTLIFKHLKPEENINTDFIEIDFAKLAESMGAKGVRISNENEIEPKLKECLGYPFCSVIHLDVDPIKHMWAPGLLHFKKMHLEPQG